MKKEIYTVGGRAVTVFAAQQPEYLLLQPTDATVAAGLAAEAEEILTGAKRPVLFAAFDAGDWNAALSPWEAPPAFGKTPFGGGGADTLFYVQTALLPFLRENYGASEAPAVIGGYSLAGLFALWSVYRADCFAAAAACSPSVWFTGWADYAKKHTPRANYIYLSLGDREEKTKNALLSQVGDRIRLQAELLARTPGLNSALEWNAGNHFCEPEKRTAKGFIRCVAALAGEDEA